jgi:glycine dehydrogenase subunit 2
MIINKTKLRKNFHQAKWDEEVIFQLHTPGERGILVPEVEEEIAIEIGDGISVIPQNMLRTEPPKLPEVGQMRVLKHYLRLSQATLGADFNIDVGQGTCTMKYSPKVNEVIARNPKASEIHPFQDTDTVQGALEVFYNMEGIFREISGLDRFSFQPSSGSHAIMVMASIVRKYHELRGEGDQRDEIITTIFSHPSDAAAAAVKGYKIITLHQGTDGLVDIETLRNAVSERTAALFITNPEDTGIFNPKIAEFTKIIHDAGGLCGYDQANANGLLGITRSKEAGFDMCFFNLHKTFGTPHGCGGPAGGTIGVTSQLQDLLPVPLVEKYGDKYSLNYNVGNTIGKTRAFYGVFPVVLKAYAWIMSLGAEGMKTVAHTAVLNNNYMFKKIIAIKGATSPFSGGKRRIEQVRYSFDKMFKETGVGTHDVTYRMADFGFHMWSSHHPFVVPEPFTIEPTEAYSKVELDEYLAGLQQCSDEAYNNPEHIKTAPHQSVVHHIDYSNSDDPKKWAITWRAYVKKHLNKKDVG